MMKGKRIGRVSRFVEEQRQQGTLPACIASRLAVLEGKGVELHLRKSGLGETDKS